MVEQEAWSLGTAQAIVDRRGHKVCIHLNGVVTAMVYEALHLRMAQLARRASDDWLLLVIDPKALIVVTNISAVEAALRGTPETHAYERRAWIAVHPPRLQWAREHCSLMSDYGLYRSVLVPVQAQAQARAERQAA